MPNTPKQTTITLKPQKKQTQKTPFCHVQNNPLFVINFCFFQHTIFAFEKLCFAENTIKIVFSEKHSFSKTQLVRPTFSPMSKNTFSKEKVSFLVLGNSAETTIFIVFPDLHWFGPKNIFGQNRQCARKCAFFSLPDTKSVRQILLKIHFFLP